MTIRAYTNFDGFRGLVLIQGGGILASVSYRSSYHTTIFRFESYSELRVKLFLGQLNLI